MAVTMVGVRPGNRKPFQPIFREYFERKISEGKTPSQALVCIIYAPFGQHCLWHDEEQDGVPTV
jgi:hypothetical protein